VELWVGPAIIAALVSALISAAGWFVTSWQAQRSEARRRGEKVHDFQVALRAEIASDLLGLQVGSRAEMLEALKKALDQNPTYRPIIPRLASNAVFGEVLRELHVLPAEVIAAVINYQRLRQSIELFVEDIRSVSDVSSSRLLLMTSDYVDMLNRLEILATNAVAALERSLALNKSDGGPQNQGSALEPALAERSASSEQSSLP